MLDFKSRITKKILNYFFLNETREIYINDLARILSEDPKNVHRSLVKLEGNGILTSKFIGKERYFSLNKKNPLHKEYKMIFMKTAGLENILADKLKKIKGIVKAYIYGSYANQKLTPESDIDLLIIGEHDSIKTQKIISEIQNNIGREINAVHMSVSEFERKKKNKDPFLKSIFKNKTLSIL